VIYSVLATDSAESADMLLVVSCINVANIYTVKRAALVDQFNSTKMGEGVH